MFGHLRRLPWVAFIAYSICLLSPLKVSSQNTEIKIGYLDFETIYEKWDKYKAVSEELKSFISAKRQNIIEKRDILVGELEKFSLQKELLPEDSVQQREQELLLERKKLDDRFRTDAKEVDEKRNQMLDPLIDELKKAVEQVAKEEKYTFIFRRRFMYYADPNYDISDKVLAVLNKK